MNTSNQPVQKNFLYWFEKILIVLAHLVLLFWMLHALQDAGRYTTMQLLYHFAGMGLYGGLLIRVCAYIEHRRFKKRLSQQNP